MKELKPIGVLEYWSDGVLQNPTTCFSHLLPILQCSNTPLLHLFYLLLHLQTLQNVPSRKGYVNRKARPLPMDTGCNTFLSFYVTIEEPLCPYPPRGYGAKE
jgi:hypothetical protein